jgi:hypothetical protein
MTASNPLEVVILSPTTRIKGFDMQSPNSGGSESTLTSQINSLFRPNLLTQLVLEKLTVESRASMKAFKLAGLGILVIATTCIICAQLQSSTATPMQMLASVRSSSGGQAVSAKAYASAYTLNRGEGSIFSGHASSQVAIPQLLASHSSIPSTKLQVGDTD